MKKHRKYSFEEIDRMRNALWIICEYRYIMQAPAIEDRLRTYMLNGTDPEELEKVAAEIKTKGVHGSTAASLADRTGLNAPTSTTKKIV